MPTLSEARRTLLQRYLRGGAAGVEAKPLTIPKHDHAGPAPLSYSQQQIWLHSQLAGPYLIYNEPITIHRHGELNHAALERSFTEVVRRHEAWRTTFQWNDGQGTQIVQPAPDHIEIPFNDLRKRPDAEREALRLATEDARQPFDLARGPMYRLRLVQLRDAEYRFYLTLHHIIFDGVSLYRVLLPELLTSYDAFVRNESPALDELPIQYPDYAAWQRDSIKDIPPDQLRYWQSVCENLPVLELKTDRSRPAVQTYAGAVENFQISSATTTALRNLSQEQGATLYMAMTAAFMTLLHAWTNQEDIVVGGITSGRNHEETLNLLGCFLNTVAIRCAFSRNDSFTKLLATTRSATLGALSHDEVPFELLVQKLTRERDPSRAPLVQALIVVEPPMEPLPQGWSFTHMDIDAGTAKFDLQLDLDDRAEGFCGRFVYNTDLFESKTISALTSRWLELLDRIAAEPNQSIRQLTTAIHQRKPETGDRQEVTNQWNGVRTAYPRTSAIHRIFEEQVGRAPSAIALVSQNTKLTYDALNRRANSLARQIQQFKVQRDMPVGVWMERCPEMVVALLAILKAGAAYVPLDPSYPAARLAMMIDDTQMPLILTTERCRHLPLTKRLQERGVSGKHAVELLSVTPDALSGDETNLSNEVGAEDLAYVMYTSGSTGIPKGVAIPHRAVVRLVKATNYVSFSPNETFLQLAPISFDASTFEIWGPLLNGGKLALMTPAPPTLEAIGNAIREYGITTLWLTAGLFNAMVDERLHDLRSLRQLLAGGEVLSVPHVGKALRELKNTRLINGYGPTESTTFACCHTIAPDTPLDRPIPIGRPIENTTVYILGPDLQPVPVGVTGELCIGGDGLARGYWRRDALTAEKFINDPFSSDPGARLYKTGDIARWRNDGVIEFVGRTDNQIKLRGYRIEPGEIETVLKRLPNVLDSAAVVREDTPGNRRLVAYIVRKRDARDTLDPAAVISALRQSLPDYLVPSVIIALPSLPRTSNGKLNRNALPPPSPRKVTKAPAATQTPVEEKICAMWADVLGLKRVNLTDNFFELGGHSLLGLRLVNQLREALGEQLPLAIVFEASTPERMAAQLKKNFPTAVERWIGQAESASVTPPRSRLIAVDRESRRVRRS